MKTYYMKVTQKDGETQIESESDGFSGFEVLAFIEWKKQDIISQLNGDFKPDIVKRKYIEDEK